MRFLMYVAGAGVIIHGLIHLLGFVAYWPLATVAEMPYTTALLAGRWEVGAGGMKLYGLLWLLATVGFVLSAVGLFAHQAWCRPLLAGIIVLSTLLIVLNWAPAFRGAIINAVMLVLLGLIYAMPSLVGLR